MSRRYDNQGRDQINIEHNPGTVIVQNQALPRSRNEQILLKAVQDEVEARLANSLHNAVFLNLGKETYPEHVIRPWSREIKIATNAIESVPDGTTITQVFDSPAIKGKLLILGQPGSGKTTTLLDLAQSLVEKADESLNYPIPVLFNLSSWKEEKQLIRDWLITELKSKYGVSPKLGRQWLAERLILPLLDGLDEVAPERQESCVRQINEFLSGEASPLYTVVCSRISEYENYKTKLQLAGAVYLKEMNDEQIQDYLIKVERHELWQLLTQSPELLNFVRTPLLLSMAVLAYPQDSTEQWQQLQTTNDQMSYLLNTYVSTMLHRKFISLVYSEGNAPSSEQVRLWIISLARQMEYVSQSEFLIEEMQPFLLGASQRRKYWLIVELVIGLMYGMIFTLVYKLFYGQVFADPLNNGLIYGILGGFLSSTIVRLLYGGNSEIRSVESLRWSWKRLIENGLSNRIKNGLMLGLISGLVIWLIGGLIYGMNDIRILELLGLPIFVLSIGLSTGLFFGLISGLTGDSVDIKISPNQGIKKSAINCMISGLLSGLFPGVIFGTLSGFLEIFTWMRSEVVVSLFDELILIFKNGLYAGLIFGLIFGLTGGLIGGGLTCIQHFTLRLFLYQRKLIPWNYAQFLDYCTECLLLQRVGGRYRFVHKLLQEYVADMPVHTWELPRQR